MNHPGKSVLRGIWPLAAAVVLFLGAIASLRLPSVAAQDSRFPFSLGEKLRYSVRWRLVPAGDAELVLSRDDAPGRWKATAKANSTGYVSNIYKVSDEYQSFIRNPVLCSSEIRKTVNEGERHRRITLTFNQQRKLALLSDRDADGKTTPRQAQSSVPDCVHDIISVLYYVRTQPLNVGQTLDIPVNDGERTVRLRVEVQAKEEIKTPAGAFKTTRLEPVLFGGSLLKGKGRMFVWFSDDARRLPVQFSAQIGVGTITASLVGVEKVE